MEVHRQECQSCNSHELNNVLVRRPGEDASVMVRCARCHGFVARYTLSGYFHDGRGMGSWLRGLGIPFEESGRRYLSAYNEVRSSARREFAEAMEELEAQDKSLDE